MVHKPGPKELATRALREGDFERAKNRQELERIAAGGKGGNSKQAKRRAEKAQEKVAAAKAAKARPSGETV